MKKVLFLMIKRAALLTSCMKDKVEEMPVVPQKTVAQKIIAKWGIISIADDMYYGNISHIDTYNGVASNYFDLRSDNKVYYRTVPSEIDTLSYILENDSTIRFVGEPYKIQPITDTKFVIHYKETYSTTPLEFYTNTITLAK